MLFLWWICSFNDNTCYSNSGILAILYLHLVSHLCAQLDNLLNNEAFDTINLLQKWDHRMKLILQTHTTIKFKGNPNLWKVSTQAHVPLTTTFKPSVTKCGRPTCCIYINLIESRCSLSNWINDCTVKQKTNSHVLRVTS